MRFKNNVGRAGFPTSSGQGRLKEKSWDGWGNGEARADKADCGNVKPSRATYAVLSHEHSRVM